MIAFSSHIKAALIQFRLTQGLSVHHTVQEEQIMLLNDKGMGPFRESYTSCVYKYRKTKHTYSIYL